MPRDIAGNYTLPSGNPVQSGEVVSSAWANATMADVSAALTNSLDRNGQGGMLAPFRFADGTASLPGAAWVNENTTGLYRSGGGDLRLGVLTQDIQRWRDTGSQLWNLTGTQWEDILTNGAGTATTVGVGTVDGQTLRWEAATSTWDPTSALVITDAGNVTVTGTVDGRNIANDGSKLDTIETNADVTDTAKVIAAGALMDSELTNLSAVKAIDQGLATTDTVSFSTVNSRNIANDGTKLDTVETNADVTDTANVTAAGALMDSELTNLAAVKAINQGLTTTSSVAFTGFTSTGIDDNASSTAITIDSSENVGIGTETPAEKLDVDGSIRASTGILFGTDTAAANTLDDYEEGDFTASLSNLGTGTIDLEKSTYTKIGRQVIVNVYMKIGSIGDASGSIQVAGLPFTSKSSSLSRSATSSVHGTNWSVATAGLNGLVFNGGDIITFYQNMATDTSNFSTDITDMGAGGSLAFTLSYITD